MKKMLKRLCTGFLALATVVTALPTTPVHAESKQYWTESKERVGIVEKVMNDGSIGSTFNEGHLTVALLKQAEVCARYHINAGRSATSIVATDSVFLFKGQSENGCPFLF